MIFFHLILNRSVPKYDFRISQSELSYLSLPPEQTDEGAEAVAAATP